MCENRVLVLPVNILTAWRAGFTWWHDILPCVLITKPFKICSIGVVCELYLSQENSEG